MEANAMEFFSQLVCFSKFYVGTDFFSKKLPKQHLFGILFDKSENLIIQGQQTNVFYWYLGTDDQKHFKYF